jgi:predicted nucleic acid-binding Zn ribbon protein
LARKKPFLITELFIKTEGEFSLIQRKCLVCGNIFELTNPNRLYCSDVCKKYATNEKAKKRYIKKKKRIYMPSIIDLTMHTKTMDNMKAKEDPQYRKGILQYLFASSIY